MVKTNHLSSKILENNSEIDRRTSIDALKALVGAAENQSRGRGKGGDFGEAAAPDRLCALCVFLGRGKVKEKDFFQNAQVQYRDPSLHLI